MQVAIVLLLCYPFVSVAQNQKDTIPPPASVQNLLTQFQINSSESNEFLQYVGDNFGKKKMEGMRKNLSLLSADPFSVKEDVWTKIQGFSSLNNSFKLPSLNNGKFLSGNFDHLTVDFLHNNPVGIGDPSFMRMSSDNSIQLLGIPFRIDLLNLTNGFSDFAQGSLGKLSFQKDAYVHQLRQQMDKAYSLDQYMSNEYEVMDYLKKQYQSNITEKLQSLESDLIPDVNAFVSSKISTEELLNLNEAQLKNKLLSPEQRIMMEEEITGGLEYLDNNKNISDTERAEVQKKIEEKLEYLNTVDKIKSKILAVQQSSKNSSLDPHKIYSLQGRLKTLSLQELRNPNQWGRLTNDLLPLNGLQKFFSHVEKMNVGTFSEESEDAMVRSLLSRAASMGIKKKNTTYTMGTGTMKDVGYLSNVGQLSSQLIPTGNMQHFSIFKNMDDKRISSVLTLSNINVKTLQQQNMTDAAFNRNVFVGSISKQFPIRETGVLTAEFSKSASQFHNQVSSAGDAVEQKAAIQTIGADFFSTMLVGVRYTDHWKELGVSHNAYLAYSGQAYNNPANATMGRGALLADFQIKKDLKKRKGYITTRYSTRGYNTNVENGADFRNSSYAVGGKYNVNKKTRVGGRVDISHMNRMSDQGKQRAYQTLKLTADANITTAIRGIMVNNTAVVSIQEYKNSSFNTGINSRLLMLNYYGLIPVKHNNVLLNWSWNKELAEEFFLSDMVNTEASYQYIISDKVQMSSGITYLNSKGYAEQIGIRQNISLSYWKNISIQAFVDARKDLKPVTMSYIYSNFRGNLSIVYSFKSNR